MSEASHTNPLYVDHFMTTSVLTFVANTLNHTWYVNASEYIRNLA